MSKLSTEEKFIDVSDYGRTIAVACAQKLKHTKVTAIHITLLFAVCGLRLDCCVLHFEELLYSSWIFFNLKINY